MQYPALAIANYFIDKANVEGDPLDHLRLQKLVYMAHGWNLAVHGSPLISDGVEAWKYGPVISDLYHRFKNYGNRPITENAAQVHGLEATVPNVDYGDVETRELLDSVWKAYHHLNGVQLSNLTHKPGTPWEKAWGKARGRRSVLIPNREIEAHFRELGSGAGR